MEAVNLLPAYARPGNRWASAGKDLSARRILTAGGAAACVAVLGLGLGYIHERSAVSDRRATLASVQTDVAMAETKAAPLRAAQAAVAARMAAAGTISASRIAWEGLLRDLSRVLPSQVYLQSLTAQSPTPLAAASVAPSTATPVTAATTTSGTPAAEPAPVAPGAAPTAFTVTGVASSHVRVALVLDRLALLPWLSNVTLQSTAGAGATGAGTSIAAGDTFSVNAQFNPTGGAR